MNKADIAIATITWARNAEEADLLVSGLEALAACGMRIFCPADQREDPERVYRMQQLAQSVERIVLSTKAVL